MPKRIWQCIKPFDCWLYIWPDQLHEWAYAVFAFWTHVLNAFTDFHNLSHAELYILVKNIPYKFAIKWIESTPRFKCCFNTSQSMHKKHWKENIQPTTKWRRIAVAALFASSAPPIHGLLECLSNIKTFLSAFYWMMPHCDKSDNFTVAVN